MNSESQSLKVVAGVFAALATVADIAHSQQIPSVPNGRQKSLARQRAPCPRRGCMAPGENKSPLKTPLNTDSPAAASGGPRNG